MALISVGCGWALAMLALYASILVPGHAVIAFVTGVMAIIPIGAAMLMQDPLDRRSPMWIAAGWILGLLVNRLLTPGLERYVPMALYGSAASFVLAIALHYIERGVPSRCPVCGSKSQLHSQLEMAYRQHAPYVLIDYGEKICPTCEARLLNAAHRQVCASIEERLAAISPREEEENLPLREPTPPPPRLIREGSSKPEKTCDTSS